MEIVIVILALFVFVLSIHLIQIRLEIKRIEKQLTRRIQEKSRQPLTVESMNHLMSGMTVRMNQALWEEEKERLRAVAEEKEFKNLFANISHDLRTPLTAIKGYLQLLERSDLTKEQNEYLNVVYRYTNELGQLIEHFFEYSYLVSCNQKITIENLNITNLLAECLANSYSVLESNHIEVHYIEGKPVHALVDREMMVRIIQNLIRNCIAHSTGSFTCYVEQTTSAELHFRNYVKNKDSIDPNRMFERGYTGDHSRQKTTGLGLAIVKSLAEQMGGSVHAKLDETILDLWIELKLTS